jgi:hypothetical protein
VADDMVAQLARATESLAHAVDALSGQLAPSDGKLAKSKVDYCPAEHPRRSCGTCRYFEAAVGTCQLVAGTVSPGDVCDLWAAATARAKRVMVGMGPEGAAGGN